MKMYVPVVDRANAPLMPTTMRRAQRWSRSGKGTFFWKCHVLCVRLNVEPSDNKKQQIAVGIDPGSKREAYTVKSKSHTFLNVLTSTPDWVKKAVEVRRIMRRARRFRNTRRRECRSDNRHKSKLPPSTRARWGLKLTICKHLLKMFPITDFVVEDIKAKTKSGKTKWNVSFSPLEIGKLWFYGEISKLGNLTIKQGHETKELRELSGLKKDKNKLSDSFNAHNVDSWVLANFVVGGHTKPDNEELLKLNPLRFHRRQLHALQFSAGERRPYGGTISKGLVRGSLVKNKKFGIVYVGGTMDGKISVHHTETGKRLSQKVNVENCEFLSYNKFRKE